MVINMKKYYNKISFKSRLINFLLRFSKSKHIFSDENETKRYIEKISLKKYKIPQKLGMKLEKSDGMTVYTYNGTIEKTKDKILLYIHGGSYIEEAISYQVKFAINIAKKTNSTLIMPIYTLAPKGNYKTMYESIDSLYKKINKKRINFLGDSAGGGFVLSYAMYLRNRNINQPQNIIMMSPWLDVSMSNPELKESEKKDAISGIAGNKYAGKLWADKLNVKNYLVSPIYGNFNDLGKMTIISGEKDILKPDCLKLSKILDAQTIKNNYIEYKGQGHDFGAYPTKEGKLLINDIVEIINRGDMDEK